MGSSPIGRAILSESCNSWPSCYYCLVNEQSPILDGKPENYAEFTKELFRILDTNIPLDLSLLVLFQKKIKERDINPEYKNELAFDQFLSDVMTKDFVIATAGKGHGDIYTQIFQELEALKTDSLKNYGEIFKDLTDGEAQHILLEWVNSRISIIAKDKNSI